MTQDFLNRISQFSPKRLALLAAEMQEKIESLEHASRESIAIIGMGCRVPGGLSGTEGFWNLLHDGEDAVSKVPPDRWRPSDFDLDPTGPDLPGQVAASWGAFLPGPDLFDANFFGIAPREAASMDPQQRLLLEVTWETLEDAGIAADRLTGSRTGVFIGICNSDYAHLLISQPPSEYDTYLATGSSHSVAAGRLSYVLGLQGPCVAIDTSCSSSLVAVHMACQSLRSRECSFALAGGVNLILAPNVTIALSRIHMMAADGRCKTFDAVADGFVRGEGCGVIALKRLSDAECDGDRILAIIRGSASNQDGRTGGLTAPNGPAQEAVLRLALANGGIAPTAVSYVEAHGTGTSLGDPIEVRALGEVLCAGRSKQDPLYIGSVKTNIGHLEAAAGIAGLIKVVLSLQHREIPAHLHLQHKSQHVDWEAYAIEIPTSRVPWPERAGTRIAGVSSFGFSGTNAHVIVEESSETRQEARQEQDRPLHVVTVSAKSAPALEQLVQRYRKHFEQNPGERLGDVAYTANVGRSHFPHRMAIVAESLEDLCQGLRRSETGSKQGVTRGEAYESPDIVFLFSGQGTEYVGMGKELYESSEVYRGAVDRCARAIEGELERGLVEVMREGGKELEETRYTQPALYAMEWGLTELWRSWGIEPSVVLGHSVGEYAAAAVAGVMGVEEGMRLAAARGRLMEQPDSEVLISKWGRLASTMHYGKPQLPIASSLTGEIVEDERMSNALYWRRQLREPVQLATGLATLSAAGSRIVVEIGPAPVLIEMERAHVSDGDVTRLASLQKGRSPWRTMLESLAELYVRGARVNWAEFDGNLPRRKLPLPTYPFQRKKYWIETRRPSQATLPAKSAVEPPFDHAPFADWFYEVEWQAKPNPRRENPTESKSKRVPSWLIFADDRGIAAFLASQIASRNEYFVLVMRGDEFRRVSSNRFAMRPNEHEDYVRLFVELELGASEVQIVFLWGLDSSATDKLTPSEMQAHLLRESLPIIHLTQALANNPFRPRLWIVTTGAQPLQSDHSHGALGQTPGWGLGKVFALECPEQWGGLIDVDLDAETEPLAAMAHVYAEISRSDGEDQIALRGGNRFVARLKRVDCPSIDAPAFPSDRTYLITGGLGEIGLELAHWLVQNGARSLVLLGRNIGPGKNAISSDPSDRRFHALRQLEALGAKVHIASGDVASLDDMKELFARIDTDMPALGGIFHLATGMSVAPLESMRSAQVDEMLHAKAAGAWNLHLLTEKMPLEYFVLFSSMVSVWGGWGLAHYAAANQFVDLLAHLRRSRGLPALAVNWGGWDTVSAQSGAQSQVYRDLGMSPMSFRDGFKALGLLLTSRSPQICVANVDWKVLKSVYERRRARPLLEHMDVAREAASRQATLPAEVSSAPQIAEIAKQLRPRLADLVERNGLASYRELSRGLDSLCTSYIVAALRRMGFDFTPGSRWDIPGLAAALGVVPEHFRVFERIVGILREDGLLVRNGEQWEVRAGVTSTGPDVMQRELLGRFSDYENELSMLGRCANHLDSILRGQSGALPLLFPDGSLSSAEHMYQESPGNRVYNLLLKDAVAAVSRSFEHSPIRILEIGAGTGASTSFVLPALAGVRFEYLFTDIAPLFLTAAKRKFRDYPSVSYQLFDLENVPAAQGIDEREFDIVIAANVVHATADLRRSLQRVRQMLRPGGILLLLELTRPSRGIDLTFGLTNGWWKFHDVDLRASYPLLERGAWRQLLKESGFAAVQIVPEETDDLAMQQTLILCSEPLDPHWVRKTRDHDPSARVGARQHLNTPDWYETLRNLGLEERRNAIRTQIRRDVAAVLNLDVSDVIRDDQSFSSLGLDSLTALELKNRLQQLFHCSLDPIVAFEYPNIRALSGFLENVFETGFTSDGGEKDSSHREEVEL